MTTKTPSLGERVASAIASLIEPLAVTSVSCDAVTGRLSDTTTTYVATGAMPVGEVAEDALVLNDGALVSVGGRAGDSASLAGGWVPASHLVVTVRVSSTSTVARPLPPREPLMPVRAAGVELGQRYALPGDRIGTALGGAAFQLDLGDVVRLGSDVMVQRLP